MLFKILHGDESRISTDVTPFHEGWAYVTNTGKYYVDMNIGTVDSPNNQRVQLNAANCETLCGLTLEELKAEIATQDAVVLAEAQSYTDAAVNAIKDNYVENNGNARFSYLEVSGDFIIDNGANFEIGEGVAFTVDEIASKNGTIYLGSTVDSILVPDGNGDYINIVGAINEFNGKTPDKIETIDTYYDGEARDLATDEGITWAESFEISGGSVYSTGEIYHRVPIVAGDNVTFEIDQGVVKINAEGGSSEGITVDEELSMESSNPVQNKVISAALGNKLETFQADDVSGGIGVSVDQIIADQGTLYLGSTWDEVLISNGNGGYVNVNELSGGNGYQMPTFDLTAMGLSEVPLDGTQSSLALDTNDIAVKLGEGPVKFIFTAMGTSISVIPSSIGVAGAMWICTTNVDFDGRKMICAIGIEVGTADAGGSIGVWFSSSATPVRGVDYWTEADKAEIKAYVDDAILNGVW